MGVIERCRSAMPVADGGVDDGYIGKGVGADIARQPREIPWQRLERDDLSVGPDGTGRCQREVSRMGADVPNGGSRRGLTEKEADFAPFIPADPAAVIGASHRPAQSLVGT